MIKLNYIPKSSSANTGAAISHCFVLMDDKLYFIFNNEKSKEELKKIKGKKYWRYIDYAIFNQNIELEERPNLYIIKNGKTHYIPSEKDYL
ncbi:MAG: hypothetical protein ACI8X3_002215, partial [Saprospiraceae bacterium]